VVGIGRWSRLELVERNVVGLSWATPYRSECLALETLDLGRIGPSPALQLEVLADCFVE
jgi:hypothetical protein